MEPTGSEIKAYRISLLSDIMQAGNVEELVWHPWKLKLVMKDNVIEERPYEK